MRDFLQKQLDKWLPAPPPLPKTEQQQKVLERALKVMDIKEELYQKSLIPISVDKIVEAEIKERLYRKSLIPKTKEQLATEALKNDLYKEYCNLEEITPSLTQTQKYDLAKLVRMPEWKTFTYCLERYKAILFNKGTKHGESKDDLLVMKAQCKNVSVIGGFWKRFKNITIPDSLTESDPTNTIDLDDR